jgi:ABC-2 type transport system permease protein
MNRQFVRLVALVARRDYLRTVRRRGFVAGTLLLPLAIGLSLGISSFAAATPAGPVGGPVVVVDESTVALTPDPTLTPNIVITSRADADSRIGGGSLDEYFLVPAGWPANSTVLLVESSKTGVTRPIDVLTRQAAEQREVELLLRISVVRAAGLPSDVLAQLLTPIGFETVTTTGEAVSTASAAASFILPYAFTLIFILSIFITSGYLLQSVTEEKENRVVEIVLSSVPALPLMAGKVLGLGAAGLTQVAVWLTTALVALPLFNQQFAINLSLSPLTIALAIVAFALGYLSYGAIFAAVGALAPGAREAQQYASFFGFLAVIPLILLTTFLADPGSPLVFALCVLPLTAPAALLEVLALSPSPPWLLVGASLLSQVVFVALAVLISGRIFRATLLLYGVRPSLRRIADAMLART